MSTSPDDHFQSRNEYSLNNKYNNYCLRQKFQNHDNIGGAGMVQWWEHSPPINVARDGFSDSTQYGGWVCCWFSSLLWEVFVRVLLFSPLLKKTNISKFCFDPDFSGRIAAMWRCHCKFPLLLLLSLSSSSLLLLLHIFYLLESNENEVMSFSHWSPSSTLLFSLSHRNLSFLQLM